MSNEFETILSVEDFTQNTDVLEIIKNLKDNGVHERVFSDIIDNKYQYVDLVMEGGGVLGIALVGYTYVLEQMGIRFLGLGGASAGAITTLLLAVYKSINDSKSEWLLKQLANQNLYDFVDGGDSSREVIQEYLNGTSILTADIFSFFKSIIHIKDKLGLNAGINFENWLIKILASEDVKINKLSELIEKRRIIPDLKLRDGSKPNIVMDDKLVIITADVSTETKVKFPEMTKYYWDNPNEVNPACFVRASMSIPIFFEPYYVDNIPDNKYIKDEWVNHLKFTGEVPKKITFVDGGIMSNFPINVFHVDPPAIPKCPTFGVRLSKKRSKENKTNNPINFLSAVFDSARHIYDFDFLMKNPDYEQLITMIDLENYNWLNFNMSKEEKIGLFVEGVKAASVFIQKFKWQAYKELRGYKPVPTPFIDKIVSDKDIKKASDLVSEELIDKSNSEQ